MSNYFMESEVREFALNGCDLSEAERVKKALIDLRAMEQQAEIDYREGLAALSNARKRLQQECVHPLLEWCSRHGIGQSAYVCRVCSGEVSFHRGRDILKARGLDERGSALK